MSPTSSHRLLTRLLVRLAGGIGRHPLPVIAAGVLAAVAAGAFAVTHLKMATARLDLIGRDVPYVRRLLDLEAEFGDLNSIVVAVRAPEPAAARAYAGDLAARIEGQPARFRGVFYRVDPARLGGRALLFLERERVAALSAAAERLLPALEQGALPGALDAFAGELEARLAGAGEPGEDGGDAALADLARALLADLDVALAGRTPAGTPLDELPGWDDAGYVWGGDGSLILLVAFNEEDTGALDPKSAAVATLRGLLDDLAPAHPDVAAALTGKPVLDVDEMRTYEVDSQRASLLALVSVTLLLVAAFRRLLAPLLVGVCLLLSVTATLGLAAVWPGHLNLMAVVFVVVVIGLGVDFGLHLVARYDECLAAGWTSQEALREALGATGPAIVAGALTTAGAFLCALLTGFRGLREFGVIAALGVLASLAIMLTVLPALVVLLDRRRREARGGQPGPVVRALGLLDRLHARHAGKVLAVSAALTAAAVLMAPRLRYEGNLLELQDPTLPSVQLELQLLRDEQLSSWFLAYTTRDLTRLAAAADRVRGLPGVARVESVRDRLPPEQEQRLPAVQALQRRLGALAVAEAWPDARLADALRRLQEVLEEALDEALTGGREEALPVLEELLLAAEGALARLEAEGVTPAARRYDAALRGALERRLGALATPPAEPLTPQTLPSELRDRLVGRDGSYLLRIYPEEDLWDPLARGEFLAAVRAALPEVTGIPLLVHESSAAMAAGYLQAGLYALGVVALFLVLHFRRPGPAALALLSLGVGAVWLIGLMGALDLPLNPANLVALPLLLGIGIDTSVHVIHRAQEAAPGEPLVGTSLGSALLFSGLTSVASFGSLMGASHPGTASIGSTVALGVLCCLLAGFLVPPAILAWRARPAGSDGSKP